MKKFFKDLWIKIISMLSNETTPKKEELNHPPINHEKSIKLGLVIGHEKDAPGAELYGTNLSEYEYNTEIAELCKQMTVKEVKVEIIRRDGIGISGAYKKASELSCDCVIELHFNAYNTFASGSLTLSSPETKDKEFSEFIHSALVKTFGSVDRKDRGIDVISRTDRGSRSVYAFSDMPNCLVEPFFGDNPKEAELAMSLRLKYAMNLIEAVQYWAVSKGLL